ncbi:MAG: LysM peptidoglycan-binding domain-containing protein [Planctomycetota bacterium]|jgi:nucleoid-associated protein YgaU|nr:LysM peptidoglycan-binding domain-containing protein [Planctomycetota bacterium]
MPFTKDLVIATSVLVGCCLVLFLTLAEPSGRQGVADTGDVVAQGDAPPALPGEEPPGPPSNDSFASSSGGSSFAETDGSGLEFGDAFTDINDEPNDLLADAGAGNDANAAVFGDTPPANNGGLFSDPALFPDDTGTSSPVRGDPIVVNEPQPAAATEATGGGTSHVVAKGETLMDISFKHYGTHHRWQAIVAANTDVSPESLYVGQKLTIPKLTNVVPAASQGQLRGDNTYVVQRGDSYYTIARDLLGDSSRFQDLVSMNSIGPYDLMPGDVIKVPSGARARPAGTARVPPATSSARSLPAGAKWHVVTEGEILGDISMRYYGTSRRWREIADANGVSDPVGLKAGQKIIIPKAGSGGSSSAAPAPRPAATPSAAGRGAGTWHVVVRGDLLESIARKQYGDGEKWRAVLEANPGLDPRRMKAGDKVWLPKLGSSTTRPAPRATTRPASTPRSGGAISWPDDRPARSTAGDDSPFDSLDP